LRKRRRKNLQRLRPRRIEDRADLSQQGFAAKGPLDEVDARAQAALLSLGGVARHIGHADLRPQELEARGQLAAANPGHDDVSEQQMDRPLMCRSDGKSRLRGCNHEDPVTGLCKNLFDQRTKRVLSRCEEDGLRAVADGSRACFTPWQR